MSPSLGCLAQLTLFLLCAWPPVAAGLNHTIKLAFIWGPTRGPGGQGYDLTIRTIQNQLLEIAGETYTVQSVRYVAENPGQASVATELIAKGIDQEENQVGPFDAIVDAWFGSVATAVMIKGEEHKIPNVHCSGAHPLAYKAYPHAFGTMVDYTLYSAGPIHIGKLHRMKTISILRGISTQFLKDMGLSALFAAREDNYTVVGPSVAWCKKWQKQSKCSLVDYDTKCVCGEQAETGSLGFSSMNLGDLPTFYQVDELEVLEDTSMLKSGVVSENMVEYVQGIIADIRLQGGDPEVLVTWLYHHGSVTAALYIEEMIPALRVGWPLNPSGGLYGTDVTFKGAPLLNSSHAMYHVAAGQWHNAMKYTDPIFGSNERFVEAYRNIYGSAPSYHVASCAAPPIAIITALVRYNVSLSSLGIEDRRQVVRDAVGELNVETLYGVIRFNRLNINIGRLTAAWQIVPEEDGGATTVAVLPESSAQRQLELPAPAWGSQQICAEGSINSATENVKSYRDRYNASAVYVRSILGLAKESVRPSEDSEAKEMMLRTLGVCSLCSFGHYRSNAMDDIQCELCPKGTYGDSVGLAECKNCGPNSEQPNLGQWACVCSMGFYMTSDVGEPLKCSSCSTHILGSSTMSFASTSENDCVCPEGKFFHCSSNNTCGKCESCMKGLSCKGGNDPPNQAAGYWAKKGDDWYDGAVPELVLKCASKKKCPGGQPLETCPPTHEGYACDNCKLNYYQTEDGDCLSCDDGMMMFPIIVSVLLIIAGLAGLTVVAMRATAVENNTTVSIIVSSSITMNCVQVLAAFRELSIEWVEPMTTFQDIVRIFSLRIEFLRPGCVFGTNDPILKYLGTLLSWPAFATALLTIFLIKALADKKLYVSKIVNAQGLVIMIFYLSLAVASVLPFQCETNPDGTASVQTMRSVLCGEGPHTGLVVLACFGCLFYIAGPLAVVMWATVSYPQKMLQPGGIVFLRSMSFLFKRFVAERYYFGVVYFVRNLIIALVTVIFVNSPAAQVLVLLLWISALGVATARIWPWRSNAANYLDVMNSVGLVTMLAAGALLMKEDSSDLVIQVLLITIVSLMFGVALIFVSVNAYFTLNPPKEYGAFLCHHKAGAAVLARWMKMLFQRRTYKKVFLDSDELDRLDLIFSLCAYNVQNLVILLTKETLRRSWCAGEITSAVRSGVHIVPLACNDYLPPTDEFLSDLPGIWPDSVKVELAGLGVDLEHILEAYRALRDIKVVSLDRSAAIPSQEAAINQAIHACQGLLIIGGSSSSKQADETGHRIIIIGNTANVEAVTTCEVLRILLQKTLQVGVLVCDRGASGINFTFCAYVVAVLTYGTLQTSEFAKVCVAAIDQKTIAFVVPVLADQFFEFPEPSFYESLANGKEISGGTDAPPLAKITEAYKSLFNILALKFTAHGSEVIIKTEVKEMVPRFRDMKLVHSYSEFSIAEGTAPNPEELKEDAISEFKEDTVHYDFSV